MFQTCQNDSIENKYIYIDKDESNKRSKKAARQYKKNENLDHYICTGYR